VVLGPGNYFGEVALLVDIPRTASIMAVEDSLLLELRKSDYHRMITLVPALKSGFDHITKQRAAAHFRRYRIPFFNSIPEDKFVGVFVNLF
jgi:CRP-like cAMP-binding protein